MKSKLLILFLLFSFLFCSTKSQTITNVVAKQEGDKVLISYNLQCEGKADISLYVSEDGGSNFKGPLKNVSGDVGTSLTKGSKTITWNALQDQSMIVGDNIVFRVSMLSKFVKFTDSRDNKTYRSVKIGKQTWMADNLAYKPSSGKYWLVDDIESNLSTYGYLYAFEATNNVCPTGWHLPSKEEFETLLQNIGGNGTTPYKSILPNGESGFSALYCGCHSMGKVSFAGKWAFFWSSTSNNGSLPWCLELKSAKETIQMSNYVAGSGFSVRCVKDE
jgi:uncharacterized protein (TIGR02145 family)